MLTLFAAQCVRPTPSVVTSSNMKSLLPAGLTLYDVALPTTTPSRRHS